MTSTDADTAPERGVGRGRVRLTPLRLLPAELPTPRTGGDPPPVAASPRHAELDCQAVAERAASLSALVFNGGRALSDIRHVVSTSCLAQFAEVRKQVRAAACGGEAVTVRPSWAARGAGGAVEIVATVRAGGRVRAMAMRADVDDRRWTLTWCRLL